ncbi:MAG: hypothetical protein FD131_3543 [Rhodocyclaceae bacterium]|nr:MAG: hypothetical protein FD131_3543 [Rhodocyclaceae bacterium]
MDITAIIQAAKLGRARNDAQVDTCAVFAAALYDVLSTQEIPCQMIAAVKKGLGAWAHAVVEVGGRYYDSMGEFSTGIYRARAKIHPKVDLEIEYRPDYRSECYESEFDELHAFYVKMLKNAMRVPATAKTG